MVKTTIKQQHKTKIKMNIIGQTQLVTEIDKIFSIFEASEGTIKPHFIYL